ncbi:hypothetical protein UA08_03363 [Talaromyces atroroseus]|uniref:DNA repair protein rhp41 n=1 Tax=Talaromyces atroroseus TaxID=1441469 RepID=A0A225B0S5_TALAT|nr:hypothetical protein UA08_03363 [Talaromyces atroroseus]OKL60866.1 hypothetical protein UA08_03363 [Talaromyces atroroseus]
MPRSTLPRRGRGRREITGKRKDGEKEEEIPEVYRELLAEADARASKEPQHGSSPVKRRKVGERLFATQITEPNTEVQATSDSNNVLESTQEQPIYDLDADDGSEDDSDMEWEEVLIQQPERSIQERTAVTGDESLDITLKKPSNQRRTIVRRRKPVSGAEKKLRLDIHKNHVLCLLGHVYIRNLWCNDDEVQKFLKRMLTKQTIALLNPKESMHQFSRSTTFIDGLKQASEIFSRRFRITAPGLRRPHWTENEQECRDRATSIMREGETITSKEEFRQQVKRLEGSRDFGAQLFCSLLRSAAVEARLVCSLQALPFSGVAKGTSPEKPKREYIVISSDDNTSSSDDKGVGYIESSPAKGRRIGQPYFKTPANSPSSPFERQRHFFTSPYPVYWVEAFNEAVQKWIPVDPLITKSVAKPSKFEPPASDRYNSMSYVVAFEEDASARDVTKRYAKAYNAKLRKTRVESTKDGEQWWANVMHFFEKPFLEDRDQLETSEFTAKSAAEPMPRNIQDFKGHPIYVLERHLRRNEVIHPKRVIGKVEVKKGSLEPVYRRADVHLVRSADGWYRLGRDIKVGEQPLKRAASVNQRDDAENQLEDLHGSEMPLYAFHQTEPYKPPPVVNGKVPKNAYGNLDVYVPSMIPPGGFHLKHPEASRAARILGIDYAAAVTGFEFKGRHGTAIFSGVVSALEHREALEEVIKCIEDERIQDELDRRVEESLRLWKHFLLRLRIAEKVNSYAFEGEDPQVSENEHLSNTASDDMDFAEAGGFLPENDDNVIEPTGKFGGIGENLEASTGGGSLTGEEPFDKPMSVPEHQSAENPGDAQQDMSTIRNMPPIGRSTRRVPHYKLIVMPKAASSTKAAGPSEDQSKASDVFPHEENICSNNRDFQSAGFSKADPIQVDSSSGHTSTSASVVATSLGPADVASSPSVDPKQSDSDPDLETRSMLSHDPEDEDAEPDWLMSD